MMLFDSMTAHGYEKLSLNEQWAIDSFLDGSVEGSNLKSVIRLLRDESFELSKNFRCFIADVLEGNVKSPKGRPTEFSRDMQIYKDFTDLEKKGNLTKTAIAKGIAKKESKSADAILKIYKKMRPIMDEYNQIQYELCREEQENGSS